MATRLEGSFNGIVTPSNTDALVPERMTPARGRNGDRADVMSHMRQVGDPLADAVIVEFDELGRSARSALQRGLIEGRASVPDAPPAVDALLVHVETVPHWVASKLLDEGDRTSLAVPPHWRNLAFSGGSLAHTYSSPAIARLLVGTGRLTSAASRRLAETGLWNASTILPGGLRHGAPGYVQTVQVRLLHARVRASAMSHGWDADRWGVPINQADVARTWLDFTVVPFTFLEGVGYRLTPEEQSRMYRYWWYVGHLLGLDEQFFLDIEDHARAGELLDLLDSITAPPDENSRALVGALFDAATAALAVVPESPMAASDWRDLLNALAGRYHGKDAAALGIPDSPLTAMLPLLAAGEAKARHYQAQVPGAVQQAVEDGILAVHGLLTALTEGSTAYQEHVAAP
ncbi:oxygenase MpaB family protein [Streptomyces millisiae]|uniref:Oxygenase MpaB family protein n=1 Tax=Streptomyces millisiae TaxID=3075542 RepID=A0ABU2LXP9_9ACTN|nr:oxygenase MpaB family protein [Streptomyces sp. DSM 44918]MDT0322367.1 oxygenase MpaB family protein [Streptomyces sp. DSM 44918]